MIRSAWRGEARGAMPKRSRSVRGPPVFINSMAQQAVPNSRYQAEFFRAQLRTSSTRVTRNPLFWAVPSDGPAEGGAGGVADRMNPRTLADERRLCATFV